MNILPSVINLAWCISSTLIEPTSDWIPQFLNHATGLIRNAFSLLTDASVLQGLLDPESQIEKGENARMSSFVGAIAIADMVKTTLGPKGMDKILQPIGGNDDSISVTNDGATILRSIYVDNAAAKVLVDIAKIQDDEVGDGTTSVAVLCGKLLVEAEKLINQRIHPQNIIEGWRITLETAHKALQAHF